MKLTIIIPVFNEKKTINHIVSKVISVKNLKKEIIIVDDHSTDGTREIIRRMNSKYIKKKIFHKRNFGKGGAIKSAQKYIKGDIVIIQDADLEYDPNDYKKLLKPFKKKNTQVVYGSRVLNKKKFLMYKGFWVNFRVFANQVLTIYSNLFNNQKLTDAHTCYKLVRSDLFKKIKLIENDFAFCPELTTKISNKKIPIIEIPISYNGRTYKEGKKISLPDAFRALYVVAKYKIIN
tara:strand:- start:62 stop:763 length:702 start_codon:yes stop_codon:yes gene_type:complete